MIRLVDKSTLRAEALRRRDALDDDARKAAAQAIAGRAVLLIKRDASAVVSGYWPIRSEIDPRPLLDAARALGHRVALPVLIDTETLRFRIWNLADPLVSAGFGTVGPDASAPEVVPDIVFLPLAGFDRGGHRIGYGKGHYDRAIAALAGLGHRPLLAGLAFAVQEVDKVPSEPHDIPLDYIVTEDELIAATPRA